MTNLVLLVSDSAIHLMDFAPSASLLDLPLTTGKAEEFADLIRGLAHAYTSATPGALAEFLHQQWFDMQPDETESQQFGEAEETHILSLIEQIIQGCCADDLAAFHRRDLVEEAVERAAFWRKPLLTAEVR